jgi:hypothetical protein
VLTFSNVHIWLEAHRGMALLEMRVSAAREALLRAETDTSSRNKNPYDMMMLRTNLLKAEIAADAARTNISAPRN